MKRFISSCDFQELTHKYFSGIILCMLFFQAHADISQVSNLPNIDRIKLDALSKQITTQINFLSNQFAIGLANIQCSSTNAIPFDSIRTHTALASKPSDIITLFDTAQ